MMFGYGNSGIGNCFGLGNGLMYGGWGMIIMLGIIALIVTGIFLLARKSVNRHTDNAALETLKMKLAKGEISEEDYLKRKNVLD